MAIGSWTYKTGRAHLIREYVKQFPGSTTSDIVIALKASPVEITRELSRMVRHGTLVAEDAGNRKHSYSMGREPYSTIKRGRAPPKPKPTPPKPAPNHPMRQESFKSRVAAVERKSAPPPPPRQAVQSVEDFLANGGHVEVLQTHWDETKPGALPMGWASGRARRSHE